MALQKIFRSATPSFKYFYKNGVAAIFMSGRYTTDQKELEDELMEEVGSIGRSKSKNPFIYVDENEPELDTEALSPLELLKQQAYEQARADLLAEMAAQHARATDAQANVSSSSSDHASSVNNSALQQASMGTDVTLQAAPKAPAVATASTVAERIAAMKTTTPAKE